MTSEVTLKVKWLSGLGLWWTYAFSSSEWWNIMSGESISESSLISMWSATREEIVNADLVSLVTSSVMDFLIWLKAITSLRITCFEIAKASTLVLTSSRYEFVLFFIWERNIIMFQLSIWHIYSSIFFVPALYLMKWWSLIATIDDH